MIDNLKSPKYKVKIPKICSFPNPQNTKSKYQRFAVSQIPKIQSQNTKDLQFPKSPKYHKSPKKQGPSKWSITSNPQNTKSKYQRLAVSQIPKIQSQNTKCLQFPKSPKYNVKRLKPTPPLWSIISNPQNTKSKYHKLAVSQIPKIPQIPKKPRPL